MLFRSEAFSITPLCGSADELPLPGRDVVGAHVAENVVNSVLFVDVLAVATDDYSELGFIVGLLVGGLVGNYERCVGGVEAR